MSDAPDVIHVLSSDLELLARCEGGEAETCIVAMKELEGLKRVVTTPYVRKELYDEVLARLETLRGVAT